MNYTKEQIAAQLDLAVLKPNATAEDVKNACAIANKHNILSVCVPPALTSVAISHFKRVSVVIGFPHGNSHPSVKTTEAMLAMFEGADELDVVINYGRFLDGDYRVVEIELKEIVRQARREKVIVKAILETHYYTSKQIETACKLCAACGVDFVKTSTGFAPTGATKAAVHTMKQALVGTGVDIKASGGIKTYKDACYFLDAGCDRIGASNFFTLLP